MIREPGVYEMSAETYHADPVMAAPSLSSSVGKLLIERSPLHAWAAHPRLNPGYEAEHKTEFDLGSAAHALMLGDPRNFSVLDFDDWRKKEAKEARDVARATGKIPLLAHQWAQVERMVAIGKKQLAAHEDAADAFTAGKPELTLIWREGDVWCRVRPDWLHDDRRKPIRDYKTTSASAEPDAFGRTLYGMGYDFQAAFYRRGVRALGLCVDPVFELVAQEVDAPHALSVIGLPPAAIDLAERKVEEAINYWGWCLKNDSWPGYPARTAYVDPPAYHEARWLDREARDDLARERGKDAPYKSGVRVKMLETFAP